MANLQRKWLCLSHYFDDYGGEQRDIQEPAAKVNLGLIVTDAIGWVRFEERMITTFAF